VTLGGALVVVGIIAFTVGFGLMIGALIAWLTDRGLK
jgi:hypothetical protein